MPERELVTRSSLRRDLAVNAASSPLPIVAGTAVAVAALVLGTTWLLPVAFVVYVALVVTTFLDPDEAARVGQRTYKRARQVRAPKAKAPAELAAPIATVVARARAEEARVLEAIADADLPLENVAAEVRSLTADLARGARRAQRLWDYREGAQIEDARLRLAELGRTPDDAAAAAAHERAVRALEDRIRVATAISADLDRFFAEMEHLVATLGVVHAQVVRMSVADDARLHGEIAGELRDLRARVGALAAGMREVDDLRDHRS